MRKHEIAVLTAAGALLITAGVLTARNATREQGDASTATAPAAGEKRVAGPPLTGRPGGRGERRRRALSEQEQAEVLEFIKTYRPGYYEQLQSMRREHPRRYMRALQGIRRMQRRAKSMPPEMRETMLAERDARMRIVLRIREIRQAQSESEKQQLTSQLRQDVSDHFDAEQQLREQRLAQLAEQLKRLGEELKTRGENREQIVAERVESWLSGPEPAFEDRERHGPRGPGRRGRRGR